MWTRFINKTPTLLHTNERPQYLSFFIYSRPCATVNRPSADGAKIKWTYPRSPYWNSCNGCTQKLAQTISPQTLPESECISGLHLYGNAERRQDRSANIVRNVLHFIVPGYRDRVLSKRVLSKSAASPRFPSTLRLLCLFARIKREEHTNSAFSCHLHAVFTIHTINYCYYIVIPFIPNLFHYLNLILSWRNYFF